MHSDKFVLDIIGNISRFMSIPQSHSSNGILLVSRAVYESRHSMINMLWFKSARDFIDVHSSGILEGTNTTINKIYFDSWRVVGHETECIRNAISFVQMYALLNVSLHKITLRVSGNPYPFYVHDVSLGHRLEHSLLDYFSYIERLELDETFGSTLSGSLRFSQCRIGTLCITSPGHAYSVCRWISPTSRKLAAEFHMMIENVEITTNYMVTSDESVNYVSTSIWIKALCMVRHVLRSIELHTYQDKRTRVIIRANFASSRFVESVIGGLAEDDRNLVSIKLYY